MKVNNYIRKFRTEFLKDVADVLESIASLTANELPENTLTCFQILRT